MTLIVLFLLGVGVVVALLARLLLAVAGQSMSRQRPAPRARRVTVAERGEVVGLDFDDEHRAPKLADNVDVPLSFEYGGPSGSQIERTVLVDGVYGESLDAPTYIRGLCALRREPRTFRVDRIRRLRMDQGYIETDVAYWVGALIKARVGLTPGEPPRTLRVDRPVALTLMGQGGKAVEYVGRLGEVALCYPASGPVWRGGFVGRPRRGGPDRPLNVAFGPNAGRWRPVVEATDLETGEVIEDVAAWAQAAHETAGAARGEG